MKYIFVLGFLIGGNESFSQEPITHYSKTFFYSGEFNSLLDTSNAVMFGKGCTYANINEDKVYSIFTSFWFNENRIEESTTYHLDSNDMWVSKVTDSLGIITFMDTSYYLNEEYIQENNITTTYENQFYIYDLESATYVYKTKNIVLEDTSDQSSLDLFYIPVKKDYGLFYSNYDDEGRIITSINIEGFKNEEPFWIKTWEYFEDTLGYAFVTLGYYHTFEKRQLFEVYLTEYRQELDKTLVKKINKDFNSVCRSIFHARD